MADLIQIRRDTAANWASVNPILESGEIGLEIDTDSFKIGDGVTAWASRTYGGLQGEAGIQGTTGLTGADSTVAGPQGIQGPEGIQGIQGETGATGPAGADGSGGDGSSATLTNYNFTATAGQTSFSGSDDNSVTLAYTAASLIVTLNGVTLENGTDYTATDGSAVVLSVAASLDDELNIIALGGSSGSGGSSGGGGAVGGGSDTIFYENGQNVTTNYTISNGKNAMSAGPITIDNGVTVTVGDGETWTVV